MKTVITFRKGLLISTMLSVGLGFSLTASADIWQDVQNVNTAQKTKARALNTQVPSVTTARQLLLNKVELQYEFNQAPNDDLGYSNTYIDLPLPNGQFRKYKLFHSPVMDPTLAKQFPDIQTYRVVDTRNPQNTGRLDMTPLGFHAMLSQEGETIFIDPIGNGDTYQSYYKSDYATENRSQSKSKINCGTHARAKKAEMTPYNKSANRAQKPDVSFGTNLRTYRLAVAATGEFSAFHGGTKEKAMAAIVTGINRVNQVYERDVAVKLQLVAKNSDIIYTNASTDPFTNDDPGKLIEEVGTEINAKIGVANYDIGHIFSTGGGGLAGFGVVCGSAKSEGVTGTDSPINDPFFIDFVAHEIGHQFKADHTFNGTAGGCSGNRGATAAYEPGSGSTIMAYASLCADEDLQAQSDVYFHTHSVAEMSEFIADTNTGGSCGVSTSLNNAAPVPNAGVDGHIPKSTPFTLSGSATDANAGDTLSYIWEQYDLGAETSSKATLVDDGSRPLFRSFSPSASVSRTFPQIKDVLNGTTTYGEVLPTMNRDLNFRFTVRDGKGGVASDSRKLTVNSAAGPFTISAPTSVSWAAKSSQSVTWDVANTTAAPINCANVDITFSKDDGKTFATTLMAATPNDGNEMIKVPDLTTTTGRLQVKCASQPFFAVNRGKISITNGGGGANTPPVAKADVFTVEQDSAQTNLAVLANDTDANGDSLTVTAISGISNGGTVSPNGNQVSYRPASGFNGTEMFNYTVSDGKGGTAMAQVSVTVNPKAASNTAPVANNDSYTVQQDSSATNLNVLANDTDADNDSLTISGISNISNGGTATVNGNNIRYQPAGGFSGTETLTYAINDGKNGTATATVTITVTATNTGGGSGSGGGGGVTPPNANNPSGGGSFGLFMLLILGAARKIKSIRLKKFSLKINP